MSRPRVLHIYKDYYPPVIGGVENTINLMAQGTRDEFDLTVLVNSGSRRDTEDMIDGIRVVRVGEWFRAASAPFSPRFPKALKRLAAEADILHFHHPNPTGDLAWLLSKPTAPCVMTYHSDVVRQKNAMLLYGPVQERMMLACRVIMPTSPNYLESSTWLQRHRNRCRVVPLGIDLDKYRKTPRVDFRVQQIREQYAPPLVLFVGRLRYYKGLAFLIDAMRKVDAALLIIGSGPDFERLRELARIMKVTPRSQFLGELPDDEVVAHMYAADLFCMPSHLRSEAFGLSQVEAMACGLPVVSTNISTGVPFVNQNGVTGYTVDPESPAALATAIEKLLSNESLRREMGIAAAHRAHTMFSAERMCRDLKEVYRSVLT